MKKKTAIPKRCYDCGHKKVCGLNAVYRGSDKCESIIHQMECLQRSLFKKPFEAVAIQEV